MASHSEAALVSSYSSYYLWGENKGIDQLCSYCTTDMRLRFRIYCLFPGATVYVTMSLTYPSSMHIELVPLPFILTSSPNLTEMRQLVTSARLVRDKFVTISRQRLMIKRNFHVAVSLNGHLCENFANFVTILQIYLTTVTRM